MGNFCCGCVGRSGLECAGKNRKCVLGTATFFAWLALILIIVASTGWSTEVGIATDTYWTKATYLAEDLSFINGSKAPAAFVDPPVSLVDRPAGEPRKNDSLANETAPVDSSTPDGIRDGIQFGQAILKYNLRGVAVFGYSKADTEELQSSKFIEWGDMATPCDSDADSAPCSCKKAGETTLATVVLALITGFFAICSATKRVAPAGDSNCGKFVTLATTAIGFVLLLAAISDYWDGCGKGLPDQSRFMSDRDGNTHVTATLLHGPGLVCLIVAALCMVPIFLSHLLVPVPKMESLIPATDEAYGTTDDAKQGEGENLGEGQAVGLAGGTSALSSEERQKYSFI